ncbi:hypothetical protein B296_00027586, partial [Ensete ventricosum]
CPNYSPCPRCTVAVVALTERRKWPPCPRAAPRGRAGAALLRAGHRHYPYGLATGKCHPYELAAGGRCHYDLVAGKRRPLWTGRGRVLRLQPGHGRRCPCSRATGERHNLQASYERPPSVAALATCGRLCRGPDRNHPPLQVLGCGRSPLQVAGYPHPHCVCCENIARMHRTVLHDSISSYAI